MKRLSIGTPLLIHLFAAAHAAVVAVSRVFDYVDDVPLTVLTLSMILIITVRRNLRAEFVAALSLICIFVAYFFGIYGALAIRRIIDDGVLAPVIATVAVTEGVGWLTSSPLSSIRPTSSSRACTTSSTVCWAIRWLC